MPRTPIPNHLIHRPEDVERDTQRFDYLCRLAEEVAIPVVKNGLFREFEQTTTTGGGILTDEAKHALEALAGDAAILEDLNEATVLEDLQMILNDALPPPDEEECHEHARGLAQLLMSGWLETLRAAQSESEILVLSDYLLPESRLSGLSWLMEKFGATKPELHELLEDVAWFAVNGEDVAAIMGGLREQLFREPRLVDLPFELVMMGTPDEPALVMPRPLYERLIHEIELQAQRMKIHAPAAVMPAAFVPSRAPNVLSARSVSASAALDIVTEPLPRQGYTYFSRIASVRASNVEKQVQYALGATD
jgi:hypothetical protein